MSAVAWIKRAQDRAALDPVVRWGSGSAKYRCSIVQEDFYVYHHEAEYTEDRICGLHFDPAEKHSRTSAVSICH